MDIFLLLGIGMGLAFGIYWGYDWGYSRGFKAGRKNHSDGMKKTFEFIGEAIKEREREGGDE